MMNKLKSKRFLQLFRDFILSNYVFSLSFPILTSISCFSVKKYPHNLHMFLLHWLHLHLHMLCIISIRRNQNVIYEYITGLIKTIIQIVAKFSFLFRWTSHRNTQSTIGQYTFLLCFSLSLPIGFFFFSCSFCLRLECRSHFGCCYRVNGFELWCEASAWITAIAWILSIIQCATIRTIAVTLFGVRFTIVRVRWWRTRSN